MEVAFDCRPQADARVDERNSFRTARMLRVFEEKVGNGSSFDHLSILPLNDRS